MTKSDLIGAICARMSHLAPREVEGAVNAVFDAMAKALADDDRIEIRGFGSVGAIAHGNASGRGQRLTRFRAPPALGADSLSR